MSKPLRSPALNSGSDELPPFVTTRGRVYYFKKRVPTDLLAAGAYQKSVIEFSLGRNTTLPQARLLAAQHAAFYEQEFAEKRAALKGSDELIPRALPAHHILRDIGSSLIPKEAAASARDRIILYLTKYPRQVIQGGELMVISGIGEWARRVRELRVQFGWSIVTGVCLPALHMGSFNVE